MQDVRNLQLIGELLTGIICHKKNAYYMYYYFVHFWPKYSATSELGQSFGTDFFATF